MAGITKQAHSRSISLPARLHPNSLKIEAELNKFTTWESSSSGLATIPPNVESIQKGLMRLAELYISIEELVRSPSTQQALHNQQHRSLVEEALDRSIGLLDACSNARDLILIMKQQVQDLQSALRRRSGGYSSMETNINAYFSFRKKSKKEIAKCLRALTKIETNTESSNNMVYAHVDDHRHTSLVIKVLRESSAITISIFQSILLLLSMQEMKTKASGWSMIRKLISVQSQRSSLEMIGNEVGRVDLAVHSLHGQIRKGDDAKADVQIALKGLETLDFGINGLETGLDCLFRHLIQNRVILLNVLTP